jgi:hypothetical protein
MWGRSCWKQCKVPCRKLLDRSMYNHICWCMIGQKGAQLSPMKHMRSMCGTSGRELPPECQQCSNDKQQVFTHALASMLPVAMGWRAVGLVLVTALYSLQGLHCSAEPVHASEQQALMHHVSSVDA